jgi:hypothetical protein
MVESVPAPILEDVVPIVSIHVPRGKMANTKQPHQLEKGRGPYWCDKTKKFSRDIRVLDGHVFCSECPTPVIGMSGILGEVMTVELVQTSAQ